jgi:hypothetical protein
MAIIILAAVVAMISLPEFHLTLHIINKFCYDLTNSDWINFCPPLNLK